MNKTEVVYQNTNNGTLLTVMIYNTCSMTKSQYQSTCTNAIGAICKIWLEKVCVKTQQCLHYVKDVYVLCCQLKLAC